MDDFTNKEEDEEQRKRMSLIKKRTIKRMISPGKRIQRGWGGKQDNREWKTRK